MRVEALILPTPPPPPPPTLTGVVVQKTSARLPRWTKQEVMLLIKAKRAVETNNFLPTQNKWASISSYCTAHGGINRGPAQCRKRWTNLSSDFKKIFNYESTTHGMLESFWAMRNDIRRVNNLPALFDKDVYDILGPNNHNVTEKQHESYPQKSPVQGSIGEEKRQVRLAETDEVPTSTQQQEEGTRKRKTRQYETDIDDERDEATANLHHQLIKALDENGKFLSSQIEAHNTHLQLDREQRNHQMTSLLSVLHKLTDSLTKIADKL